MNLLLAEQSTQELLGLMLQASNVLSSRADTQPAEISSCVAKLINTMAKVHAKSVATADSASSTRIDVPGRVQKCESNSRAHKAAC